MKQLVLVVAMLFMVQTTFASQTYIVKVKPGTNVALFAAHNKLQLKPLVKDLGLFLATTTDQRTLNAQALSQLRSHKSVNFAQPNHKVTFRGVNPNDKDVSQQWGYMLDQNTYGINAVEAWSVYGTGGLDAAGNEIVVAIVDGGFDIHHPDLVNNLWVNKAEVAGNNLDDDGNGYIDDINGWDVEYHTGTIQVEPHGTHVAGTIGAEGNNGLNGVGVNWKVKIMYVSSGYSLADTAGMMEAYGYILKQKQLWLQSGGKQGANVVSVNSSFGVDRADCSSGEYAAWNDIYNQMGSAGILNVAATANAPWDIDQVGDVPTGCSSDYIIAVTNSEINGDKTAYAGYGVRTIDIAAPGTDIMSTLPNKSFGDNSGTSMATPHVTGAVGYLYSAASPAFINDYIANPAAAALAIKSTILKTVTVRESMKKQTASSGILNLFTASQEMANYVQSIPMAPGNK